MSSIGPELPPHLLAKRKRKQEAEASDQNYENEPSIKDGSLTKSPDSLGKRRKLFGPAPPPVLLDEQPDSPQTEFGQGHVSSSEDEDAYGPSLPSAQQYSARDAQHKSAEDTDAEWSKVKRKSPLEEKPKRDDWMMLPPKQDDLAARMDPTKRRATGFNTGRGAQGPSQITDGDNALWTETLEQKRKRLEDEVMGVSDSRKPSSRSDALKDPRKQAQEEETARRVREYNDKYRTKSLYDEHKTKTKAHKEKEDDPSKRAFDYEKDMAGGSKIGHAQRRQMLSRAAGFGSKFSGGSFL